MNDWLCPLCNKEIDSDSCYNTAMCAEEVGADETLPSFISPELVEEKRKLCLNCKYHPQ